MQIKYCEVCEEDVPVDEDGNAKPCGFFECPQGLDSEEEFKELDFDE